MQRTVFEWMKTITYFYLLLTVSLHLLPNPSYKKYLKQFMGLYLMTLLVIPVLTLFRDGKEIQDVFEQFYLQESSEAEEAEARRIQELYLRKGIETQIKSQIESRLKYTGVKWKRLEIVSEGDRILVEVNVCGSYQKEKEAQILDELERSCAVISEHCTFTVTFDDTAAVDRVSAAGASAAGADDAGEGQSE